MTENADKYSFEEISTAVIEAVAEVKDVDVEKVKLESTFEELDVDSLDAMEMLFLMEERLDISMPDEAARAMTNVRQVAEAVQKLLRGEELDIPKPAVAEDTGAESPATGSSAAGEPKPQSEAG